MGKIIFSLMIIFLTSNLFAGIYGKFEAGKDVDMSDVYFTSIDIGYKIALWNITSRTYGGWFTWQENNNPFMEIYSINQKLNYNGFFIKLSHYCGHKVISYTKHNKSLSNSYEPNPQALSTFSVGYEFEFK